MKAILSNSLFVPKVWVDQNPGVLAHFTYQFEEAVNFGFGVDNEYTLEVDVPTYRLMGEFYEFARGDLQKLYNIFGPHLEIEDRRSNVPIGLDLKFTGVLRPLQKEGIKQFLNPTVGGLIVAKPAFGKTVVMCGITCLFLQRVILLVNKTDLKDQFMTRMREHTNIIELEKLAGKKLMGELEFNGNEPVIYPITVTNYQLFVSNLDERTRKIKDLFGLVLVDECHRAPADCLTRIVRGLNPLLLVGVSATPWRKDGYHRLLPDLLGPIRYTAPSDATCEVQIVRGHHFPLPKHINWSKMINVICKHVGRNRKIVDTVVKNINDEGRRVLVLTQRVEHASVLYDLLTQENILVRRMDSANSRKEREERTSKLYALENAINYLKDQTEEASKIDWDTVLDWQDFWNSINTLNLISEIKEPLQKFYAERADCLVTTTKLASEGSDYPSIDTVVIVCPMANDAGIEQIIGRVQREYIRKKSPRCIYFSDSGHGALYGCTAKFKKVCAENLKYQIEDKSGESIQEITFWD